MDVRVPDNFIRNEHVCRGKYIDSLLHSLTTRWHSALFIRYYITIISQLNKKKESLYR